MQGTAEEPAKAVTPEPENGCGSTGSPCKAVTPEPESRMVKHIVKILIRSIAKLSSQ
jgi:hypothetical protein